MSDWPSPIVGLLVGAPARTRAAGDQIDEALLVGGSTRMPCVVNRTDR